MVTFQFNPSLWSLFVSSPEGKAWVTGSEPQRFLEHLPSGDSIMQMVHAAMSRRNSTYIQEMGIEDLLPNGDLLDSVRFVEQCIGERKHNETPKGFLERRIRQGLYHKPADLILCDPDDPLGWCYLMTLVSMALYRKDPETFFPLLFNSQHPKLNYRTLRDICSAFFIPLAPPPPKKNYLDRALHYLDICSAIGEFRERYQLTPAEGVAFVYGFALRVLEFPEDDPDLPAPSKVWFAGANRVDFDFLDHASAGTSVRWQANPETRRGDIIVMYCLAPRSTVHSVWRATGSGFSDPFFHYHNMTYIDLPIRVPHISHRDLKANPLLRENSLFRKNLQGVNGWPLQVEEYEEFLRLWETEGSDTTSLPRISRTPPPCKAPLECERDVEIHLVEPLLSRLGFTPKDWTRQMPVRMGRGERYYPDYCVFPRISRGEESASLILETKLSIPSRKSLEEAFFQARSYAMRLQSKKLAIVSKEGVWVFPAVGMDFRRDNHRFFRWEEVLHPDSFHELRAHMGRDRLVPGKTP